MLTLAAWSLSSPYSSLAQNSKVEWWTVNAGAGVPTSSTTAVKSAAGQVLVGLSQTANTRIESGFLAAPLLRSITVGIPEVGALPTEYSLSQNFPNPFNPSTTIQYDLPVGGRVMLSIYNVLGQHVATLVNEDQAQGRYSTMWKGTTDDGVYAPSGVYFCRIEATSSSSGNRFVETRKLMLLK